MYAAGKIPGGFFKREGRADRAGDPDRAHDRPPDPAALAEGLPQRGAGDLHDAVGRPGHPARHPVHQRRVRGADDLAAAVPRPDRRRPHRRGSTASSSSTRRCSRRGGVDARPDRRRHARRADDGRGRRRRDPRGRCSSRRSTSRTPRSASSATRRRSCARQAGKPKWLDAELTAEIERDARPHDLGAHPERRPARGRRRRRGAHRRARARALDGLDRGGHRARRLQVRRACTMVLEKQRLVGGRGPGARAVRERPARPDRRRAGLEGAASRRSASCSSSGSSRRSSCRSRSARRPSTATPGRQGLA